MKRGIRFLPLALVLFALFCLPEKASSAVRYLALAAISNPTNHAVAQPGSLPGSIPARVVLREPALWSSCFWINVGQRENRVLGYELVAKNSPVLIGKTVVGVVDEVLEKRCRVRLITDRLLNPSVRALRGGEQNRLLYLQINQLIDLLSMREDLYGSEEMTRILASFQNQLDLDEADLYLAKGEIHGMSAPLWRTCSDILQGIGFNYDHDDEKGKARNLRTGQVKGEWQSDPLIKTGDLLVTTGMDGLFPPDLHVGIVTKILPLREGGCSYSLEAKSLIPNIHSLCDVSVLPPV